MIRLAVRVNAADAEMVLAELLELVPGGVEEVELPGGMIEYAVYGAPGELPGVPALRAAAGGAHVELSSSELADDWGERWKRFHKPVLVRSPAPGRVPAMWVGPPWEAGGSVRDAVEIVVDPGQAFGTGGHATTRLCLELLLQLAASAPGRGPLVDVGTGSGVLAIAAAKLGYSPVVGLDHDRESVIAARQNASVNDVSIDVKRIDVRREPVPLPHEDPRAPAVIVANLLRPLLLELAHSLSQAPSHLLASGLLTSEVDEVAAAYSRQLGLRERERRERGEWAAVWLSATGHGEQERG